MLAIYVMMVHKRMIKLESVPVQSRDIVAEALRVGDMDQNRNIV